MKSPRNRAALDILCLQSRFGRTVSPPSLHPYVYVGLGLYGADCASHCTVQLVPHRISPPRVHVSPTMFAPGLRGIVQLGLQTMVGFCEKFLPFTGSQVRVVVPVGLTC